MAHAGSSVDEICLAAREAVDRRTYLSTKTVGGAFAKEQFTEVPTVGGILIGFRVWKDRFVGSPVIGAFQAIYLTAAGEEYGRPCGAPLGEPVTVKARPGYAVGAILIRGGGGMDSITLTFMKIEGDRLDPSTTYMSEKVGGNGGSPGEFNGGGTPILGASAAAAIRLPSGRGWAWSSWRRWTASRSVLTKCRFSLGTQRLSRRDIHRLFRRTTLRLSHRVIHHLFNRTTQRLPHRMGKVLTRRSNSRSRSPTLTGTEGGGRS